MTELGAIEPFDPTAEAVIDYRNQARIFLERGWRYLAEEDLHQASEKGWGAAAWMAKAVAEAQGWQYNRHDHFFPVMRRCQELSGDARVDGYIDRANTLHTYFYTRRRFLGPDDIRSRLADVAVLLDILEALAVVEAEAAD